MPLSSICECMSDKFSWNGCWLWILAGVAIIAFVIYKKKPEWYEILLSGHSKLGAPDPTTDANYFDSGYGFPTGAAGYHVNPVSPLNNPAIQAIQNFGVESAVASDVQSFKTDTKLGAQSILAARANLGASSRFGGNGFDEISRIKNSQLSGLFGTDNKVFNYPSAATRTDKLGHSFRLGTDDKIKIYNLGAHLKADYDKPNPNLYLTGKDNNFIGY